MIRNRPASALLLCCGMLLAPAGAMADDARAVEIARRSFEAGIEQYRSGDLEGARISLAQSYAAWPSVETLRNLAIAELNTDHVVDALKHFKMYARDKNADPAFVRTKLQTFIDRCEQRVGHFRIVASAEATVSIDGHHADPRDVIDVPPGPHALSLRDGPRSETRTTNVPAGATIEVDFLPTTTATTSGEGAPGTTGDPRLVLAGEPTSIPSGTFWTARNTWLVALGAAAGVSAGVGVAFGVAANANRSTIDSMRAGKDASYCTSPGNAGYCDSLRATIAAQQSDATASNVALGFAGALGAGALVLWAVWPSAQPTRVGSIRVAPSVGAGSTFVMVDGDF